MIALVVAVATVALLLYFRYLLSCYDIDYFIFFKEKG